MKSGVIKSSYVVFGSLIIYNIFKLAASMILSYKYGAGVYSDAFLTACAIPAFIATLAIAIVIILFRIIINKKSLSLKLTHLLYSAFVLSVLLISVTIIFLKPAVKLFALGFGKGTINLTAAFCEIIVYSAIPALFIIFIKTFTKNAKKPLSVLFESLPFFLSIIAGVLLSEANNYMQLSFYVLGGFCVSALLNFAQAYKTKNKTESHQKGANEELKWRAIKFMPLCISALSCQIVFLTDRSVASTLGISNITLMSYAQSVQAVLISILFFAVSSGFLFIRKNYKKGEIMSVKKSLLINANNLIVVFIPITLFLLLFSRPVIMVFFERGAFDKQQCIAASQVLAAYSLGLLPIAFKLMLDNIYFSINDSKTPLIAALFAMVLNAVLDIALAGPLKLFGVALASSISYIFTSIIMLVVLKRKIGRYGLGGIIKNIMAVFFTGMPISIVAAIFFSAVFYSLPFRIVNLLICVLASFAFYAAAYILAGKIFFGDDVKLKINLSALKYKKIVLLPALLSHCGAENYYRVYKDSPFYEKIKIDKTENKVLAKKRLNAVYYIDFIKNTVKNTYLSINFKAPVLFFSKTKNFICESYLKLISKQKNKNQKVEEKDN